MVRTHWKAFSDVRTKRWESLAEPGCHLTRRTSVDESCELHAFKLWLLREAEKQKMREMQKKNDYVAESSSEFTYCTRVSIFSFFSRCSDFSFGRYTRIYNLNRPNEEGCKLAEKKWVCGDMDGYKESECREQCEVRGRGPHDENAWLTRGSY